MAWCGVVVREEKKVPPGEERPVTALLPLLSLSPVLVFFFSISHSVVVDVARYHIILSCRVVPHRLKFPSVYHRQ